MTQPFSGDPISELQKRLGLAPPKRYNHDLCCSGDRRKPPGTYGICCCCKIVSDKGEILSDLGKSQTPEAIAWRNKNHD